MEKTIYEIHTLSDYINLIKDKKLDSCLYRGENKKYDRIVSSLIRDFNPTNKYNGLINVYDKLLTEYYQEIGNDIDSLQRENFLAFSQHHGLKTNLIDFTTAPLIALYFACDTSEQNTDAGYIYILENSSTVDATEFLTKYSSLTNKHFNIYQQLANKNEEVIMSYKKVLSEYERLAGGDLLSELAKLSNSQKFFKKSQSFIEEYNKLKNKGIDRIDGIIPLIQKYFPDFNILGNLYINVFITLLLLYFDDIKNSNCEYLLPNNLEFPKTPYLIYRTPLKFDRIRNQCGVFLYQGFVDYYTTDSEIGGIMIQEIFPDITIKVHNQKEILEELDMVGINKMFIYGDFDSTAEYINMKFFK